ncbi:MAG: hypothetical protein JWN52_5335, partial [Actinomycetia bacterium]|nr:hypothetical protein [Actinomycetes bacterium]
MLGHSRSGLFQALLAPLTIVGLLALAAPASAQVLATERVAKDQVALTVGPDGVVHAKETISYDFNGGRGLERSLVTKIRDNDTRDRIFKIEGVKASSPDGGPTNISVTINGDRTIVKVSGSHAVSGRHTVALEYDVRGAVATLGNAEELRWSAVGGWRVPVLQAKVSVDSGSAIRNINCFAGSLESSTGCTQFFLSNHTQTRGEFSQPNLLPDEYLTVVVGYPLGMTKAQPLYEMRRTLATAFTVNTVTGGSLLGLLVLLLGGFGLLYQLRGRDARTVSKKAAEGDQAPVDSNGFAPPDGVRPGQIGTLIDEQADVIDVTATIVDLAVRGYLLI